MVHFKKCERTKKMLGEHTGHSFFLVQGPLLINSDSQIVGSHTPTNISNPHLTTNRIKTFKENHTVQDSSQNNL